MHNEADLSAGLPRRQVSRERVGSAKDSAIHLLKEPETGYRKGEGRWKTTVRVIELAASSRYPNFHLGCVRVEVCEV